MATFEIIIKFFPPKLVIVKSKFTARVFRGFMHYVLWLAIVFAHLLIGSCFLLLLILVLVFMFVHTTLGSCAPTHDQHLFWFMQSYLLMLLCWSLAFSSALCRCGRIGGFFKFQFQFLGKFFFFQGSECLFVCKILFWIIF